MPPLNSTTERGFSPATATPDLRNLYFSDGPAAGIAALVISQLSQNFSIQAGLWRPSAQDFKLPWSRAAR
jgi:hypothetical protein